MSRILKYKESLLKFIKDRSCLFDENNLPEKDVEVFLMNNIKRNNMILPILFLTIMNNQNKKNGLSLQGYYVASSIEFLDIVLNILEKKKEIKKEINKQFNDGQININMIIQYLIFCVNKSLYQNLECIKRFVHPNLFISIFMNLIEIYNETISFQNIFNNNIKLEIAESKLNNDILKWYIRDNNQLKEKYFQLKQITIESLNNYINKKIGSLCVLAICAGWILGGGNEKELNKIKKIGRYFSMIFKLARDFCSIEKDIVNCKNGITTNYVINYGLQESYELFMYNKQKFIEETMMINIYTTTIKEIIDSIETKVDEIIDETSPDIKSNCSK